MKSRSGSGQAGRWSRRTKAIRWRGWMRPGTGSAVAEVKAEFQISDPVRVHLKDTPVMFIRASADSSEAIQQAWARFEAAVGLKGRRFFGSFDNSSREYRVCTELKEADDPRSLGCEAGTLPGGAYLRARLQGEPPAVYDQIPAAVGELLKRSVSDESRPTIEFYRSRNVIDVLLPIS